MTNRRPPIIATVLLLLALLYVGSYLAMVHPRPDGINYGRYSNVLGRVFWPLEQIDMKLRPGAWAPYPSTAPDKPYLSREESDKVRGGVI